MDPSAASGPGVRTLLVGALPALAIGVVSALSLWGLDALAELVRTALWDAAPAAAGIDPGSPWWIVAVLTLTGLAVGAIVQFVPGHAGDDSATVELSAGVQPLRAVPGIAAATVIALAGGVSLGPESPIIAINVAIAVALLGRVARWFPTELTMLVTASGTLGAMFGTPVAAALAMTGIVAAAAAGGALWDRMFLPLVAAGAGSATTVLLGLPTFALDLPPYRPQALDLATGSAIAMAAAAVGVLGAVLLPLVHRAFRMLRHPVLYTALGGLLLGLLGVLGGPLTMFKGLHETIELLGERAGYDAGALAVLAGVKLAALLVAAGAGFRGGRVFPAVFVGVALGLLGHALIPELPTGLAVGAGVLGILLAVMREGWLALFIATAVSGDFATLPILCVVLLPAWLVVTSAPEFIVRTSDHRPTVTDRR